MSGPLQGVNVLELCMAGVGPFACNTLGALGANVIKIEPPSGDIISIMAPYQKGVSAAYTHCNLNKRSIVIDLKNLDERPAAVKLVEDADIIVENMRPGRVDRLGLGHEQARCLNPSAVYVSAPAWGMSGPMRDMPGIDGHMQMFSGFASLNGAPGGPAEMYRHPILDWVAGSYVAAAALTGLLGRTAGRGQHLVVPQISTAIAIQATRLAECIATGASSGPAGTACSSTAPHQAFLSQDGRYLAIGVLSDAQWVGFCRMIEDETLAQDDRFATNRDRVTHQDELTALLEPIFGGKPARWWTIQAAKHGVPASPYLDLDTLLHHQQVLENGFIEQLDMPHRGNVFVGGLPWQFSKTPVRQSSAPVTGEHTAEVLSSGFGLRPMESQTSSKDPASEDGKAPPSLKVVELAQGLAGPYAGLLFAENGAEVIKVEPPGGDFARQWAPDLGQGDSAAFALLNRNKTGIVLDTADAQDREQLQRLLQDADVLILDRVQNSLVDCDSARVINPRLVCCEISAYGNRGPLADLPGSELTVQALGDVWSSLGGVGKPPARIGADVLSLTAGIQAYTSTSAALFHRGVSGKGQRIWVSILGAALHMRGAQFTAQSDPDDWYGFYCDDSVRPQMYGYQTADFPVFFNLHTCSEDDYFRLLIRLGIEECLTDPRFENGGRDAVGMGRYAHEVQHLWEQAFRSMTSEEVVGVINGHNGMAIAMNDHARLLEQPQVKGLGLFREMACDGAAPVPVPVRPFTLAGHDIPPTPSPRLTRSAR